ncbi:MAG: hypothetical protein IKE52_00845 [Mogibacterium sp.]|nr:hypothetical protein [Mogibacterium sp.]
MKKEKFVRPAIRIVYLDEEIIFSSYPTEPAITYVEPPPPLPPGCPPFL